MKLSSLYKYPVSSWSRWIWLHIRSFLNRWFIKHGAVGLLRSRNAYDVTEKGDIFMSLWHVRIWIGVSQSWALTQATCATVEVAGDSCPFLFLLKNKSPEEDSLKYRTHCHHCTGEPRTEPLEWGRLRRLAGAPLWSATSPQQGTSLTLSSAGCCDVIWFFSLSQHVISWIAVGKGFKKSSLLPFLKMKFNEVTLVMVSISGVQHYGLISVYATVCSPPKCRSLSLLYIGPPLPFLPPHTAYFITKVERFML